MTTQLFPRPLSCPTRAEPPVCPPRRWFHALIRLHSLLEPPKTHSAWHSLRKGINLRARASHLEDLVSFKGISQYDGDSGDHTSLPCPAELLVEEHHSNYGEPWAGGSDVFEFLAFAIALKSSKFVLEVGCGTLRVGLHFIQYLDSSHFHCFEQDELSFLVALRYELSSQGLLNKCPLIRKWDDVDFSWFGKDNSFDLIYASAIFLHIPDQLARVGLERLPLKLKPKKGRIFVLQIIKFCSRIKEECSKRLEKIGLEYSGNHTHDNLFNHYELWYEFRGHGNKSYL